MLANTFKENRLGSMKGVKITNESQGTHPAKKTQLFP